MNAELQNDIWKNNWAEKADVQAQEILNTRFTKKAYKNFKAFIDKDDKLILEAGCGTGRLCCLLARDLPDSIITGIDITQESLDIANKIKQHLKAENVEFKKGDIFNLDYPDDHFDVVFNNGVIEHFPLDKPNSYNDALREMIRVLKPGGKIIVDVPNWFCFAHTLYKWILAVRGKKYPFGYEKSFTRNELKDLFAENGLEHLEFRSYDSGHGIYRLRGYSHILRLLGDIAVMIDNPLFEKMFGFMLLIKGVKPDKKAEGR
jgi:SAM-dependent methyltransferase